MNPPDDEPKPVGFLVGLVGPLYPPDLPGAPAVPSAVHGSRGVDLCYDLRALSAQLSPCEVTASGDRTMGRRDRGAN
jgi:hypothetical protein